MGEYDKALRAMEDADRRCPRCKEMNVRGASPTIVRQQDGSFCCDNCSYSWKEKQ